MSRKQPTIKVDILKVYPYNLIAAVIGNPFNLPDEDMRNEVYEAYVPGFLETLSDLTEREQKVLFYRFEEGFTLERTGKEFGISRGRIQQIQAKALRKLRHPRRRIKWTFDTMQAACDLRVENEKLKKENERLEYLLGEVVELIPEPDISESGIDELNLSVRTYNCLTRRGIETIGDLIQLRPGEVIGIRNLGQRSYEEIVSKLAELGLSLAS